MDLQLSGKRALVTGSSSGIGEAIARSLAAEGVAVVVHGRREAQADGGSPRRSPPPAARQSSRSETWVPTRARPVAKAVNDALGGADILVNNAGAYPRRPSWSPPPPNGSTCTTRTSARWCASIARLVPGMKQRGWGRVISLASIVATMPFPGGAACAATKSSERHLAVSLAKELGRHRHYVQRRESRHDCHPRRRRYAQGMALEFGLPADDLPAVEHSR